MNDQQLAEIFTRIHQIHFPKKRRKVDAVFYPYRSLRHTIEWTPFRIGVKVSRLLQAAPLIIIEQLAIILLSKVYKLPVDAGIRKSYRQYAAGIENDKTTNTYGLRTYKSKGRIYDLHHLFDQLNDQYFEPLLKRPVLGWSKKNSFTRLGFYDASRNLLVISRIFDDERVPGKIVLYLLFHEMLHIYFPTKDLGGRRVVHSREFREMEKQFPEFENIQKWLKKNIRRLG